MKKRIPLLIISAALIGGIFGSLVSAESAQASIFQNLYERFLKPFISPFSQQQRQAPVESQLPATENSKPIISLPLVPAVPYSPTIDYEQAVVKAVEQASPAVVSIVISKDLPIIEQCPYNPFGDLPEEYRQFFGQEWFSAPGGPASGWEFYQPCQKGVQKQEVGGGSGFIISAEGLIVTNKHVVSDAEASYTVLTNDARKYEAQVVSRDPSRDFAVIKIKADNLSVVRLGDSDTVKLGQTAIAIGNALGEFRNTVSVGVISGLARTITASGGGLAETIEGVIQTDAAINQGNSGGPLLNLKGEVIGINAAMVSGAQNIGFAIPINQVKRAIESVKKTGKIVSPYIGIRYLIVSPELKEKENLPVDYGALIRGGEDEPAVMPDSPAAQAGLQAEDIVLELNGEKITREKSLAFLLQKYNVGDVVNLKVLRDGKEMTFQIKLGERP